MNASADGILYDSTRQSLGLCRALFGTPATTKALGSLRKIGAAAYDNPKLLASLIAENIAIVGS